MFFNFCFTWGLYSISSTRLLESSIDLDTITSKSRNPFILGVKTVLIREAVFLQSLIVFNILMANIITNTIIILNDSINFLPIDKYKYFICFQIYSARLCLKISNLNMTYIVIYKYTKK